MSTVVFYIQFEILVSTYLLTGWVIDTGFVILNGLFSVMGFTGWMNRRLKNSLYFPCLEAMTHLKQLNTISTHQTKSDLFIELKVYYHVCDSSRMEEIKQW